MPERAQSKWRCILAIVMAVGSAPIDVHATRGPVEESAGARVIVLPMEVEGELPEAWREQATRSIEGGLAHAGLRPVPTDTSEFAACAHATCARRAAAAADYVLRARLTVDATSRDYALRIDIASTKTGETIATVEGTCPLCGFEEVVTMLDAKVAAASASIERLSAAVTMLLLETRPPGALVEIDGAVAGHTPLTVELEPGPHRVRASRPGFVTQSFEVEAIEGARKALELVLVEAAPRRDRARERRRAIAMIAAGSVLLGGGLGAAATGAGLLAIDGEPRRRDCQSDGLGNCRYLYGTRNHGVAALSIGTPLAIAGAVLVVIGARRRAKLR